MISLIGFPTCSVNKPRKPPKISAVVVTQYFALKTSPVESRAAMTLSCLPRFASIK
jgi:hypothetical protein